MKQTDKRKDIIIFILIGIIIREPHPMPGRSIKKLQRLVRRRQQSDQIALDPPRKGRKSYAPASRRGRPMIVILEEKRSAAASMYICVGALV